MSAQSTSVRKRQRVESMITSNDLELITVEEMAKRCRERQYQLKSLLNSTSSIMSSLPSEIIAEIFLIASYRPLIHFYAGLPTQLVIGRVCKAWRELAWNTPRLWCMINISLRKDAFVTQKCLVEEWIQRSANCPLHLKIKAFPFWELPEDAFGVIINSCSRWKTFISIAFKSLSVALNNGKTLQFPLLERFELGVNEGLKPPLQKWDFNFPPCLKILRIRDSLSDRGLAVNWSSLTDLSANIMWGPTMPPSTTFIPLGVLATCKCLVNLDGDLYANIADPAYISPQAILSFPFLETLSLSATTSTFVQFTKMTRVPSLKSLSIGNTNIGHSGHTNPEGCTTALLEWAESSSFKLELLHISLDDVQHDSYISSMLYQLSPEHPIKSLSISIQNQEFNFSDTLVAQLTMQPSKGVDHQRAHLPKLLSFNYFGNISFKPRKLIRMLESRVQYADLLKNRNMNENFSENNGEGAAHGDVEGTKGEDLGAINEETSEATQRTGAIDAHDSSAHFSEALSIAIEYRNRDWYQKQFPNIMRDFYRSLEEFEEDGRTIYFGWTGFESDVSDEMDDDDD